MKVGDIVRVSNCPILQGSVGKVTHIFENLSSHNIGVKFPFDSIEDPTATYFNENELEYV